MGIARRGDAQALLQPDLARCRIDQVGTTHDIGNTRLGIVGDDRQLVGEQPVSPAQHAIPYRAFEILFDPPLNAVVTADHGVRYPQAPGAGFSSGRQAATTGAGINPAAIDRKGACRAGNFPARAGTRVEVPVQSQSIEQRLVGVEALRLPDDIAIPFEAEALERGQNFIGRTRHVARGIDILDAHEPAPAGGTGIQIAACRRDQRPEMERPCRRRRKAAAIAGRSLTRGCCRRLK